MDWIDSILSASAELMVTCGVTALAAVAVWIPFQRGLGVFLRARAATRRLNRRELESNIPPEAEGQPVALATLRVLIDSLEEGEGVHSKAFIKDAVKQYALHDYDSRYAQPMAMYANILPPLGFIGTTLGLVVLFASMHFANQQLEIAALGVALSSTLAALMGFATLEGLKIRLYTRLQCCIDDALAVPLTRPNPPDAQIGAGRPSSFRPHWNVTSI